jgi:hypothetical protein
MYYFHLHGQGVKQVACTFFDPDDGGNTFLKKLVNLYHTVLGDMPEGGTL